METACADDLPGTEVTQSRQVSQPPERSRREQPGNPRSDSWEASAVPALGQRLEDVTPIFRSTSCRAKIPCTRSLKLKA
jgi:hypothetical protein